MFCESCMIQDARCEVQDNEPDMCPATRTSSVPANWRFVTGLAIIRCSYFLDQDPLRQDRPFFDAFTTARYNLE